MRIIFGALALQLCCRNLPRPLAKRVGLFLGLSLLFLPTCGVGDDGAVLKGTLVAQANQALAPPLMIEGYGEHTTGGEAFAGSPFMVTRHDDPCGFHPNHPQTPWVPCAGTNSLREAMSNENSQPTITNRYVKFFESGVYDLNFSPQWAKLILANASNVTLDGGAGVIIDGGALKIENANNIIIKNITFRNCLEHSYDADDDCITIINSTNVVLDHVSLRDGQDGVLDIANGCKDVTVQWSIIARVNTTGLGTNSGDGLGRQHGNITFHHNLFHNLYRRSARMYGDMSGSGDSIYDFRNNVVSEWGFEGTIWRGAGGGISTAKGNAINNQYLCTGSCPKNSGMVQVDGTSNVWPNVHTSGNEKPSGASANYNPGTASLFSMVSAVTTQSANAAADLVFACAGAWPRDAANQAFAGPLDTAQCDGSPPPAATCGDGIIDAGEVCDDANTVDCDGCKGDCSAYETQRSWYPDNDADSFGDIEASANSQYCQPAGEVLGNTDCDDNNAAIHPNATEQCSDSIDNNCDGQVDEGCGGSSDCQSLWGHLTDFVICNEDPVANTCEFHNNVPGTTCDEVCADAGGTCFRANRTQLGSYGACYSRGGLRCTSAAYANDRKCFCTMPEGGGPPPPAATCGDGILDAGEVCDDANTVDCDGCKGDCSAYETQRSWYPDNDTDSFGDIEASANSQYCQPAGEVLDNTDCDDNNAAIHPNATEQCSDSIDNNCDGQVDEGCGGSSDCQSLWGHLTDFAICNEDPVANTCEFHNNVPGTTCDEVCADAGGTCFGANRTQLSSYGACYPRGGLRCTSAAYANDRKCFCTMP